MDTDEDEDTMNSDDATAKKNIELDHNYALQPSQFPHPQLSTSATAFTFGSSMSRQSVLWSTEGSGLHTFSFK